MTEAEVESLRQRAGVLRDLLARTWAFYFAHRPKIVLGMGLYLVLIHAVAAGLLWQSQWPGVIAWKLGLGSRWVEFDDAYRNRVGQLRRFVTAVDPGAVLFIGDSLLASLDVSALADRAVQLSIPGDTARRTAARMGDYGLTRDSRLVFLHVGTNDLRFRAPAQIERPVTRILSDVPPRVPVIVSAILPVDERVFHLYGNADIRAANEVLERVCTSRPGCRFVDTSAGLMDDTGNLDPRYHDDDGLHLNAAGKRAWRAALVPFLEPWRSF